MSLKRRIAALERCYAVGTDGRCVACPPISFSVAWGDDPSAEARPLERCRSCGRARERFILCINTPHQAPAREEKEPSGTRADAVNGPVAAPGGPEGRGRSRDDAAPGLATTAPPRDTTDVARSAAAEALSRDAPAEVSSAARRSPIANGPQSEPVAGEPERRCTPWPIYVAARPIEVGRLRLRAGEPFPFQDKRQIRHYGPALGVPDADRRPFHELPYVAFR